MFDNASFYRPDEAAVTFKVAAGSVYQSMPRAKCRPKLGRKLTGPLRLGRSIQRTAQQLNAWAGVPQPPQVTKAQPVVPASVSSGCLPKGRPRKVAVVTEGSGS